MEAVLNGTSAHQQRFEIGDPSQVSYARRGIGELAHSIGCGETVIGKLAIIVTECATNQLKHAQRGELLVRPISETALPSRYGIELLAIDSGPGIHDLHACFVDGYTTAGSPGNGMGAIQRLADDLDIWSAAGLGTVLRIVVWADSGSAVADLRGPIEYGAINLPLQGEMLCGDAWTCGYTAGEFTVMVADGLGHGALANSAAIAATDTFARLGPSSVEDIVAASHEALRPTRGAALGVARIPAQAAADGTPGVARFCGVGNIAASVWTPYGHRHLVSHAGIVGHQLRKAQEFQVDWPQDGLLILHSDGLATRWDLNRYPGLTLHHPTLVAATLYRDFTRGRDDVTVFVARTHHAEHL
ncbi:ATP-binding protein [Paraburkholderia sediminicola]|uniref:ATP-binding protein n=1 Tax=Paraburkholderia sediminicola TaxID=458836 RepID=UPI0038BA0848